MTVAIVDSTVIVHLFRKNSAALTWFGSLRQQLSVTPISWLEIMYGAPGKSGQATSKAWLARFEMVYLTTSDQAWAMEQMEHYRLSRGIEINDCLIASACYRLQVPIYAHNVKDITKLLPTALVIKPY